MTLKSMYFEVFSYTSIQMSGFTQSKISAAKGMPVQMMQKSNQCNCFDQDESSKPEYVRDHDY
eukprot:1541600-Amphidinium_carterae.1